MKAWIQHEYGPSDVLALEDVPTPTPGDGEVLVRVMAASINAADWHVMRGEPRFARLMDRSIFGRHAPQQPIPGRDLAGVVEAVGAGVDCWQPGDEVMGEHEGTLAEYAVVPADRLVTKPAGLSVQEAAGLPLAGVTADLCVDRGGVTSGDRVLVIGASGGVGTFAVQLAVARGADVTGVCSTRNIELVRSLDASHVIDYTTTDFARTGERYDVVIDLVGNRRLRDLGRVVAPGGRLVLSGGGNPGEGGYFGPMGLMARGALFGRFLGARVKVPMAAPDAVRLAELAAMAAAGDLRVVVERTYTFAEGAQAVRHLEVDHARGKVVVTG